MTEKNVSVEFPNDPEREVFDGLVEAVGAAEDYCRTQTRHSGNPTSATIFYENGRRFGTITARVTTDMDINTGAA